jgi:hypothetical protein
VLVDFSANPVNVMCSNFLQQMEIDALEQLISEDVKVQGQIVRDGFKTCLVIFKIIVGVVARVITGVVPRVVAGVVAGVVTRVVAEVFTGVVNGDVCCK